MKAILDYTPEFCPNCGAELHLTGWAGYGNLRVSNWGEDDFKAGNVMICSCGAEVTYSPSLGNEENNVQQ